MGWFSGSFFSKNWIHPGWFFWIRSGSYLKLGTVDYPNGCFEKAIMFSHAFSSMKLNWFPWGFCLAVFISYPAPDFKNIPTSFPVSFLAVINTLKQIINMNVILSFSNRPLLIYLWTCLVITLIINSTLFCGEFAVGDFWARDQLNNYKNCSRELLYIQFTKNS